LFTFRTNMIEVIALLTVAAVIAAFAVSIWIDEPAD
jgi:hypothetical protein